MADNQYRIQLGVDLRVNDIRKRISEYNKSANNAKLQLGVRLDTADLKKQINALNASGGTKGLLSLDTKTLEASLNRVANDIKEIRAAFGTLDSKAGMNNLLTSINQISTALDRASKQFVELNTQLNSLAGKNFGVNIGLNMGNSNPVSRNAAYGSMARGEIIPQLQQQVTALETYLARYYKVADGFNAVGKLIQGTGLATGMNHPMTLLPQMADGSNLSKQMGALKQYIALIKEAAAVKGVDLTPVTSKFTQSADQLVTKAQNVQSGTAQMEESFKRLQGLFGSGINAERLSAQLDSIVADLGEIRTALQGLSQNASLNNLTQSFNNLSASLEKLVENATQAQNVLNNGLNTSGASAGTQKVIQEQNELAQVTTQTANAVSQSSAKVQQSFVQMASVGQLDPINLKDDISETDRFAAALSKLKNIQSNIGRIEIGKINTSNGIQQLKTLEAQLKSLSAEYNKTVAEINGMGGVSATQLQTFQNQANTTALKLEQLKSKIIDTRAQLEKGIKGNFGTYENQLLSLEGRIGRLTTKTPELQMSLERVRQALSTLKSADGTENLVTKNQQYLNILKQVEAQVTRLEMVERNSNNSAIFDQQKAQLALQMSTWLRDNSAAAKQFGGEIQKLQMQLNNLKNDPSGLRQIREQFKTVTLQAKEAGVATMTFGDRLKAQLSKYSTYLSGYMLFMYAIQAMRSMFNQVKSIDSAMTELKKVTDETEDSYNRFLTNAASRAKKLGTTIDGLVGSTADFARLGYSFKDAQGLAEVANIYAVVGDEVENVEQATESLISTMAAFKEQRSELSNEDFAMEIIDKFNEIGNNFAISSGGIGDALTRSASSLAAANNTLDESIALITAANTVVQDPDAVGTAFKTISMRIRGAKTELEEAGLETDGMVESTAKLRSEILALSGVDIMENANEFKSTYKIMDELAAKWEDLSDIQQATVTELIAGKRQGNIVSSLMTNFDTAREALETSLGSSGSAMKEHKKWQESLEARINNLKAAWQSLSQSFMNSDFLKVVIDLVIGLVNALDKLVSTFGTIPTLLGSFMAFKGIGQIFRAFSIGGIKSIADVLAALSLAFPKAAAGVRIFTDSLKASKTVGAFSKALGGSKLGGGLARAAIVAKGALKGLWTVIAAHPILAAIAAAVAAIAIINKLTESEKELAKRVEDATTKYEEQHDALVKLKNDYNTSKEDSLISKYGKLSKGVSSLGENVSLTADEYAEYQSVVNTIADQMPSIVAGYNSQGDAILSCVGSVEKLTQAYKDLIIQQNRELLMDGEDKTSPEDIFKDFKNDLEKASSYGLSTNPTGHIEELARLMNLSDDELEEALVGNPYMLQISETLGQYGFERDVLGSGEKGYQTYSEHIIDVIKNNRSQLKEVLKEASEDINAYADDLGSVTKAYFSTAFLGGDSMSNIEDYSHLSDRMQNIISQITSNFGSDFYAKFLNNENPYEALTEYFDSMLKAFDGFSAVEVSQIEAAFDLQTKFNGGEISYGEYVNGLENVGQLINKLEGLDEDVKSQIKLSLGLNEEGLVEEYEALLKRLTTTNKDEIPNGVVIGLDAKEAEELLNNLSSEEFSVVADIIPEFEPMSESEIEKQFDKYEKGGNVDLTLRPEVDTSVLKDAGWEDAGEGAATVFTSTFSNEAGNVAMNFTPIIADENGNHIGTLSPEELQEYAEGVIAGTRKDDLNLQIGAKFEGENAVAEAENVAKYIHKLQDYYYNGVGAQLDDAIERAMALNGLLTDLNIEVETTGIEALNTALAESKSATGLTVESIDALKARYEDLKGYNVATLFEETANGIRLNSTELARLETEYKKVNKQDLDKTLEKLVEEYNELTIEIDNCSDASKRANLYAQRDSILDQINDTATLAAQYKGLTSAYNEWQSAQEAGQDRDQYESIISGREEIEDEMSRGWLDDATVEYLELLSGKELSTAGIDAQIAAYKELDKTIDGSKYKIWDFFTKDEEGNATSDGVFNFFDTVRDVAGETAAWVDENGKYHFDFEGFEYEGEVGDAAIAKMLGTSEELVQIILKAAEDAGFVVNIKGEYTDLANLRDEAEKANDRMKELGATTYTFNFDSTDINDLNKQIDEAETMLGNLKNKDGTLKVGVSKEDYRQAQDMIAALIYQKQSLDDSAILHVDTSQAKSNIENAILKLQEFKRYTNTLELETAIGADTSEVTTNIQSTLDYINGLDATIKTGLGLDTEEVQTAINNVQADIKAGVAIKQEDLDVINATISSISNDMMVELGLDTSLIDNYKSTEQTANGTVNWDNNIEKVTAWINQPHEASGTVKWNNNTDDVKTTFFGNGVINWTVSEANGTANANGTAFADGTTSGRAFKQGDWSVKDSGTALGGELGTEILVRDGRWYTIGDNGAEFFQYKKGDIIFNHRQTEELFANGKVTSGGGRGKALAEGTAFRLGSIASGVGRGFISSIGGGKTKTETKTSSDNDSITVSTTTKVGSNSDINGGVGRQSVKDTVSSSSSAKENTEETFDWIEVAIDRIERAIDKLDQKANNIYKSWSDRNGALTDQISKVRDEIELQQRAYDRYIQEANSVGLSSSWASKVRNGEIDIDTITDEKLADKIGKYQEWYEKALDCKDAIEELRETEAELYAQRVENVATQYEGILGVIEHEKNMLEEYISQNEANAQLISGEYYKALIGNENETIDKLEKQKDNMLSKLQEAMSAKDDSGNPLITEGSEAWYELVNSIDEVTLSIAESETQLLEYQQTLQQLSWERFDLLQDKISSVTDETEFLIELMSSDKLFEDNGQLTNFGSATMGLHGVSYNAYMYQADLAAKEAERLKKQMSTDGYDTELEERYREMVALQQEYILGAQNEKEAIRDLVEEGINLELDALQELIDKKNEELESERDLYEYQKKVKEQTKEIASLEKQMAAYAGDTSEEAQQRIQQIKVDLESARQDLQEAEYDKYISDQSALLDELYVKYEEILNMRLDNLDALVSDVITQINTDATSISSTLSEKVDSVGYTLSDSMKTIWTESSNGTNSVITTYGEKFTSAQTTTNNALKTINTNLQNMIIQLNSMAKTNVKSASISSAANSKQAKEPKKEEPKKDTSTPTIKVGGMINASGAPIYDYAGDTSGERQLYRNDPKYKVLGEKNGYLLTRWHKLSSGYTGWFKKSDVKALATGAKKIDANDMAWTQEKGQEYIVRPSDGAILTPVAKGDSVLTSAASNNIWNMANSPAEFIKDNLSIGVTSVPNNSSVQNNCVQNFDKVVFNMPNVKNYGELLSEMQRDPKFEKLILAMTVDQIAGKSKLAKGKSIR